MPTLLGLHHLTAVSADIRGNLRFYTQVLGLRLVKRSVNQDDVSAYHLFYADGEATPGSDLTFFDWQVPPERRGNNSVTRTELRVSGPEALSYWQARLTGEGVRHTGLSQRYGRAVLDFEDPEGQRLSLVDDGGAGGGTPWARSPVPPQFQIRGLGAVTLSVPGAGATDAVLTRVFGLTRAGDYREGEAAVQVYAMQGEPGPQNELHLAVQPGLPPAQPGAGGVHHVALRCADDQYEAWSARLTQYGLRHSGEVDRHYFRSLYYRDPAGLLFEIATDGPGFDVDEPRETMGERIILPPFLEGRRAEIVAGLKPLD